MNAHTHSSSLAIAAATPIPIPADLVPADGSLVALTKEYAETYADLLATDEEADEHGYDAILAKMDALAEKIRTSRPQSNADAAAQLRFGLTVGIETIEGVGYMTGDLQLPPPEELTFVQLDNLNERASHEVLRYLEGLAKRDDELWALLDDWTAWRRVFAYHCAGLTDDQINAVTTSMDAAAHRILKLSATSPERVLAKTWVELDARWGGYRPGFELEIGENGSTCFEDIAARCIAKDVQAAFPQFGILPGSNQTSAIDPALGIFAEWCRRTVELETSEWVSDDDTDAKVDALDDWSRTACADDKIGTGPLGAAISSFFAAYLHCGRIDKEVRAIVLDWTNPHTTYPDLTRDASKRAFRTIIDAWPQLYAIAAVGGDLDKLSSKAVH